MAEIKVYESEYIKNPAKWIVLFVGWDETGEPWAMCHKNNT